MTPPDPANPAKSSPTPHDHPAAPYGGPAAGWGATKSIAREVLRSGAPLRCVRTLSHLNQPDGVDCPGCAWPDPDHKTVLEFCENGAKHIAWEATKLRTTRDFFARHSVSELRTHGDQWLEEQGRLTEPFGYNPITDHYEPLSWDAAFARFGTTMRSLSSPDRAVFYTSGRASNEAAFLYQLFGRAFGTNNFPDCSNMCHESSGVALSEVIGVGKGTVSLHDFELADAIFVLGQNPGSNHPRMLSSLEAARARGAEIVSFNPLVEVGLQRFLHPKHPGAMLANHPSEISTHYLQPLVGGDLAALKGICCLVLDAEDQAPGCVLDHAFIAEHCHGFEAFAADLRATVRWDEIERESGLSRVELETVANVYITAKSSIVCWAMGLTQQKHAVATLQMLVNLLLLRGNIGRPGAGACPVRGHSNVQGDRTVGINHLPPESFLAALDARFGFTSPRHHGYDTVEAIRAMRDGVAQVFVGLGGNFLRATPDTALTESALRRCRLTVHIATKLNHSHLATGTEGALLLPCLGRTEVDQQAGGPQVVTVEDSMSMCHASHGTLAPATPYLRSETAIVAGLAHATLGSRPADWLAMAGNYDLIRDHIEAVIPGFTDYNRRCREPHGFYLGNPARERQWTTASGRANFTVHALPRLALPVGQLRLMTMRSHDQFNTTVYSANDRYRGIEGNRRVVFVHPDDLAARGLVDGALVDLCSHWHDGERHARGFTAVAYDIPFGCAAAYFPEANILVPLDSVADKSNCPTSKFVAITLTRALRR